LSVLNTELVSWKHSRAQNFEVHLDVWGICGPLI